MSSFHHSLKLNWQPEIGILASKLLGFETFANFLRVSFLENLVSEKSLGFGEFGLVKKVSVSLSENWVLEEKSRYQFQSKFWYRHSMAPRQVGAQ